ncbi:MAG: hypothetical protein RL380_550 [Verrucomicrobiota bacterium]
MRFAVKIFLTAAVAALLALTSCTPSASSPLDEQREPHFLTGKSRANSLDYEGAIEAFEKALEVNPQSASAHLELGLLFENRQQDFPAAVYHYDRYLKLRANAENADLIRQHSLTCKQEIARTVLLAPVQQNMQRDLERATEENRDLRQKLEAWQQFYSNNVARMNVTANPTPTAPPAAPRNNLSPPRPGVMPLPNSVMPRTVVAPAPRTKKVLGTHAMKSGETPAAVARKYGVKLEALLAANPNLDPKRLRIGQIITIPAP